MFVPGWVWRRRTIVVFQVYAPGSPKLFWLRRGLGEGYEVAAACGLNVTGATRGVISLAVGTFGGPVVSVCAGPIPVGWLGLSANGQAWAVK